MAKFTGPLLTLTYNSGGWNANFVRGVTIENTADVVDSTGAADTSKTYIATLEDGTVTIEIIADSSTATIATIFQPATSSTLTVYPNGNTTGKLSIAGTAIVTGLGITVTYNELVMHTITLQISGGLTWVNV